MTDWGALRAATVTLPAWQAGELWSLGVQVDDRSLEEQAALVALAEALKSVGYPDLVLDDGEEVDIVTETHKDWHPEA